MQDDGDELVELECFGDGSVEGLLGVMMVSLSSVASIETGAWRVIVREGVVMWGSRSCVG